MARSIFLRGSLLRRVSIALVCITAFGLGLSWMVAGALVAPCPSIVGDPPRDMDAVSFSVPSDSGSTIQGWHVRSDADRAVVVLLHGIRGSRMAMTDRARMLHAAGYSIVAIDLQAHGESPGKAITAGHLEKFDVQAAVAFAKRQHPGAPLAVVGVSLGGAAAVLGSPLGIDALVLEAVYPSIDVAIHNRVAKKLGPLSPVAEAILLWQLKARLGISPSQLRPIEHVPAVGCPILILSGLADEHTTVSDTQALFDAAVAPKEMWLVDRAAHVDLFGLEPAQYEDRVLGFLARYLRGL